MGYRRFPSYGGAGVRGLLASGVRRCPVAARQARPLAGLSAVPADLVWTSSVPSLSVMATGPIAEERSHNRTGAVSRGLPLTCKYTRFRPQRTRKLILGRRLI